MVALVVAASPLTLTVASDSNSELIGLTDDVKACLYRTRDWKLFPNCFSGLNATSGRKRSNRRVDKRKHMSLTESAMVYAGIHENAVNDLLTAFSTDRPRYLVYGSPSFVPTTTIAETSMPGIPFPGVPGGIQWRLRLTTPQVDLFQQSSPLPPELTLTAGEFSLRVGVELCLDCRRLKIDPRPPRPDKQDDRKRQDDRREESSSNKERHPIAELTCCRLKVFAVGHIEHVLTSQGEDAIAFGVDAVEIVDIKPKEVEAIFECILFMILQAVLAEIRLPLRALRAGAFQLTVTQGPLIEDDQIKARGDF